MANGIFLFLQCRHILLEELPELFVGKHFANQPEDRLLVLLIELLYKPDLLNGTLYPR